MTNPFGPQYGSNQVVALAAATPQAKTINADSKCLRVVNSGAGDLYVRMYSSLATAAIASAIDCPVLPSTAIVLRKDDAHDRVSLFSAAGTTAQIMTGEGSV